MNDKSRQFLFYALVIVGSLVVLAACVHFIRLLNQPIPESVQSQLWVFASILLGIAIQVAREYAARPARRETQSKLDTTLATVQQLHDEVHNGLQDAIAQKTAEAVIEKLPGDGNGSTETGGTKP